MAKQRRIHEKLDEIFSKEIFFIVGFTRPGANWLQRVLDAHPDICCKGEGHFTDHLYPMLGRTIGLYNQQTQRSKRLLELTGDKGESADFSFNDLEYLLGRIIGLVFNRWVGDSPVRCIGEKTPENSLNMELLSRAVPKAKFIHVIRDGRDEAVFAWEFSRRVYGEKLNKKYPDFASFSKTFARKWSSAVGKARLHGRNNPDSYMEVRCEDIYIDPAPVVTDLLLYLGMEAGEGAVSACLEAGQEGASPGASTAHREKYFDEDSLRVFHRYGGELLKLMEYEV
ncbi:MAG: sulfotransferase [Rhodospirillales bacterium]